LTDKITITLISVMEEIPGITDVLDDDVEFKKDPTRKCVAIYFNEEDKEIYDILTKEYGVKTNRELVKAARLRLHFLRDSIIRKKTG
jgi:hypothetical protein